MIVDLRRWDGPASLRCDLCIVGAGAAGITLARELGNTPLRICLVEGGGLEPDSARPALYQGVSSGQQLADPQYCRLRYFGGTTNHWQGWCAPLDDEDFTPRPWIADSGWPIDAAELAAGYARAARICQLGDEDFQPEKLPEPMGDAGSALSARCWRFSPPTRFGSVYRDELAAAENLTLLLSANVQRLVTDDAARRMIALRVTTGDGKGLRIEADCFVLAAGGMENPRLLLLTDDVHTEGLGNASGLVGRFFTQHIEVDAGRIVSSAAADLAAGFKRHDIGGGPGRFHWRGNRRLNRDRGILNWGAVINANVDFSAGYSAARELWSDIRRGAWPDDLGSRIGTLLGDLDGLAGDLYDPEAARTGLTLRLFGEQAPNPDSRVTLAEARDPLGMRRLQVDWRLSDLDRHSLRQAALAVAAELGQRGLGRLQLADWLRDGADGWPEQIWSGCHHMGTTRMADDPRRGVVDRDCRVHGVDNLYLAGSSVFPTGGYVPPTLTIVALAVRLAGHLRDRLAGAAA